MISPFVRRWRLASELRTLREGAGFSPEGLGKAIGRSRTKISRLENGQVRPDQAEIMKILDVLKVSGEKWTEIITIAREAAEKGWWESLGNGIGERQAIYANLEAGAVTIREFQQNVIPGLLQTSEFTRTRIEAGALLSGTKPDPDGMVEGRAGRQRMLHRLGGPDYEVIIDEVVIRRLSAPPPIFGRQLRQMADSARQEKTTVRVLPVDAQIADYYLPLCAFSTYGYADPGDPTVVAIEAVTSDLVLTNESEVARYLKLYDRLRDASLSTDDSLDLITSAADRLPAS